MTITDKPNTTGGQGGSSSQEHGAGVGIMAEQMMQETAGKAIPVGYKQTEVGVIPEDWDVLALSAICDVRDGTHDSPKYKDSGIPLVTSKNIVDDVLNLTNVSLISPEDAIEINKRSKVDKGDIIMSMIGTVGSAVLLIDEPEFCIKNVALFKPKRVIGEFLIQLINSRYFQGCLEDSMDGGIQKFVSLGTLRNMAILLPSRKEQTAIANVLSDSDALIDALEQLIAKKQAIKSATMQQLLTGRTRLPAFALRPDGTPKGYKPSELGEIPEDWEVTYLLDVATLIHGKAHEPYVTEAGKYIVINSKFVSTGGEVRKYCSQNDCAARNGDVLMVLSDLPNGKALAKCFYADQNNVYAVNQRVCIFRTNIIDPKYLYLVLNRHKYFLALDDGVTQTHILNGDIANCQLYAPVNKAEQTAIATILSDMDNELQALTQKLDKARALKQGMMQQLLTGKIRLPLTAGA